MYFSPVPQLKNYNFEGDYCTWVFRLFVKENRHQCKDEINALYSFNDNTKGEWMIRDDFDLINEYLLERDNEVVVWGLSISYPWIRRQNVPSKHYLRVRNSKYEKSHLNSMYHSPISPFLVWIAWKEQNKPRENQDKMCEDQRQWGVNNDQEGDDDNESLRFNSEKDAKKNRNENYFDEQEKRRRKTMSWKVNESIDLR